MLGKLLKHDLKRSFSWFWILSVVTIGICLIARLFSEVNNGSMVLEIFASFFNGITIALIVNVILQPFIRYFVTFQKDFYGDESYLTHTLPVTKNELLYSRYLSSTIQTFYAVAVAVLSFFILYWSPAGWSTLTEISGVMLQSNISGFSMSIGVLLFLVFLMMLFWVFAVTSTGYMSIIISSRFKKFKGRKNIAAVILAVALIYAENFIAGIVAIIIMLICGVDLSAELMPVSALNILIIVMLVAQVTYWLVTFFVSRYLLNKGVNVD